MPATSSSAFVGVLVEVEGGDDEDAGAAARGDDPAGRLDAVHAGHADVHEDDVGAEFGGHADGFGAVFGLAYRGQAGGALQKHAHAHALQGLVVGDEDGGHG
jgi:hypothetical protein